MDTKGKPLLVGIHCDKASKEYKCAIGAYWKDVEQTVAFRIIFLKIYFTNNGKYDNINSTGKTVM